MTEPLSLDQSAFIVTYTGGKFFPFAPAPEMVKIEDIAHSLSQLCRFTGHTTRFYSVAEHSLLAAKLVPAELALEALLHDAHETYTNDLARPLKKHPLMTGYEGVADHIDRVIRHKFGLPEFMSPEIKVVDNRLVCTEGKQLLIENAWTKGHEQYDWTIPRLTMEQAEQSFLRMFDWLKRGNPISEF